jgi:hypothetical protein
VPQAFHAALAHCLGCKIVAVSFGAAFNKWAFKEESPLVINHTKARPESKVKYALPFPVGPRPCAAYPYATTSRSAGMCVGTWSRRSAKRA